jgi:hypothetical protein
MVGAIVGHAATAVLIERMMYNSRGYLSGIPEGLALPFMLAGAIAFCNETAKCCTGANRRSCCGDLEFQKRNYFCSIDLLD